MASNQKVLLYSTQRLDLPNIQNMQNYMEDDLQTLNIQFFTGASNCIIRGFEPVDMGGLALEVTMANAKLFASGRTDSLSGSLYSANASATALGAVLSNNLTNYVHIKIDRAQGTPLPVVFWNITANSGAGGEWSNIVNTIESLEAELYITTGAFSVDPQYIPVAEVVTAGGSISSIKDRRNLMFRLGRGYPFSQYYINLIGSVAGSESEADFDTFDKGIYNMKTWMDCIMSEIKDIKFGTSSASWYESAPASLLSNLDMLAEGGFWEWEVLPILDGTGGYDVAYTNAAGAMVNGLIALDGIIDGTAVGTFTVGVACGLIVGNAITITQGVDSVSGWVKSIDVNNPAGSDTIEMETAKLRFGYSVVPAAPPPPALPPTENAVVLMRGTAYTNIIECLVESPVVLPPSYIVGGYSPIGYVSLDRNANSSVSINVVNPSIFTPSSDELIIIRRLGDTVYIGNGPLALIDGADGRLSFDASALVEYCGSPTIGTSQPDFDATIVPDNVYFIDNVTDKLTSAIAKLDRALDNLVPIGTILEHYPYSGVEMFLFNTDPTKGPCFHFCDGTIVNMRRPSTGVIDMPMLLPDTANRYLVGLGTEAGGDVGTAGWDVSIAGNSGHIINIQHSHTVNAHNHVIGSHSHTVNAHTHTINAHIHTVYGHYHSATGITASSTGISITAKVGAGAPPNPGSYIPTPGGYAGYSNYNIDDVNHSHVCTGNTNSGTGVNGASNQNTSSTALTTNSSSPGTSSTAPTCSSPTPGTNNQLLVNQSIQPRSIRVRHIIRTS